MQSEVNEDKQDDELDETEDAPKTKTDTEAEPAPSRKPRWGLWLFVLFLVLVLAVVGLGWYASTLRDQVGQLKAELDGAQQQAGSLEMAVSAVAGDLMPLAEESVLVAKLRQASGDPEGAAGALHRAKQIADMARRLTPTGGPAKLAEIEGLIGEVETALSKRTAPAEEPPAEETGAGEAPAEGGSPAEEPSAAAAP
jgi:hypothetical protein